MPTSMTAMTNQDPAFYPLIGPFLARREVHQQVGGTVYDEDGKTWIVARDGDRVVGFIGVRTSAGVAIAESCYVAAGYDDLVAQLVRAAVTLAAPTPVRATVHADRATVYEAAGFVEVGRTRSFVKFVRKCDVVDA